MNFSTKAAVCFVAAIFLTAGQVDAELITNGDFETGDFTGWDVSQAGGSSVLVAADPGDATLGPSPTSDFYAFAGNQGGPSQNIFTQTFAVPTGLTGLVFSFDYASDNFAGVGFVNPSSDTLSFTGPANQQFRVEILTGTAAFDTVNPADIVFTAIRTVPGSTDPQPWTSFSQDIFGVVSPFQGQNLQVRFAQADNQGPFDIGFDNVSLAAVPEPSTWVMGLAGLACAAWGAARRRKRT